MHVRNGSAARGVGGPACEQQSIVQEPSHAFTSACQDAYISKRKDVSVGKARMANLRLGSGSVDVFEGVSAPPLRTQESTRRSC